MFTSVQVFEDDNKMNAPDRRKCSHNLDTVSGIYIIKLYYQIIIDIFGMKVKLDLILKFKKTGNSQTPKPS